MANASNENLHYSLYHYDEGMFICDEHKTLSGNGEDLRSHALLEQVVEILNTGSRFLQTDEEKNAEYRYLSKFTDDWLSLIDATPNGEPTPLGYVNLRKQKGNAYHISVMKDDVDKRTARIIENIICEMTRMINDCNVELHQIGCVVFLGDTFENQQFQSNLEKQIADTQYIHYREKELANVVSVYKELPEELFDSAEIDFKEKSEAQAQQALETKKRRDEIEKAKRLDEETRRANAEKAENERNKQNALNLAEDAERKHRYTDALDLYKTALANSPDNTYIQEKIDEITELIAEQKSKKKQYDGYISAARNALDEKNWTEAETQSQMALNVMPDSDDALHIQEQAKKMRIKYERLREALLKLDMLIEQKDYDRAQQELQNISLLGVKDKAIEERKVKIARALTEMEKNIKQIESEMEDVLKAKNYVQAINLCEMLIQIDKSHHSIWTSKLSDIKSQQTKERELQERYDKILMEKKEALWDEDWTRVVMLCEEALSINYSKEIEKEKDKAIEKVNKALERKKEADKKQNFTNVINEIKALISDEKYDIAEDLLRQLRRDYVDAVSCSIIKDLSKRLFEAQEQSNNMDLSKDFFDDTQNNNRNRKKNKHSNTNSNSITNSEFNF